MAYGRVNIEGINSSEIETIQQNLESINGLIGKTNDTGGTATAGTIIAKLNKLLTDWTTTRAGYISNIYTYTSNLNSRVTSERVTKLDNIGTTEDTGGTSTTGTVIAKLNKLLTDWTTTRAGYLTNLNTRLTSTRAGYLDKLANFGATGDTGGTATTGTLMAKVNALLNAGGSAGLKVKSVQHGYVGSDTSGIELDTNQYRKIKISTVNVSKSILLSSSEIATANGYDTLNKVPTLNSTYLLQPYYRTYSTNTRFYTGFSWAVIEFQ